MPREELDVGLGPQSLDKLFLNRFACGITHMENTARRVGGLTSKLEVLMGIKSKRHLILFNKQLADKLGTFSSENLDSAPIVHSISSTDEIFHQPRVVVRQLGSGVGDEVEVAVKDGIITISPRKKERGRYNLKDLVARIPADYQADEVDWGEPVGKEAW